MPLFLSLSYSSIRVYTETSSIMMIIIETPELMIQTSNILFIVHCKRSSESFVWNSATWTIRHELLPYCFEDQIIFPQRTGHATAPPTKIDISLDFCFGNSLVGKQFWFYCSEQENNYCFVTEKIIQKVLCLFCVVCGRVRIVVILNRYFIKLFTCRVQSAGKRKRGKGAHKQVITCLEIVTKPPSVMNSIFFVSTYSTNWKNKKKETSHISLIYSLKWPINELRGENEFVLWYHSKIILVKWTSVKWWNGYDLIKAIHCATYYCNLALILHRIDFILILKLCIKVYP